MARACGCPGHCIYCPTYGGTPQSYTPESPSVIRARACDYDAFRQVDRRLFVLADMGHPTDKVEIIVMGGTFLATPVDYQYQFIKDCYDAVNGMPSTSLAEAQKINETAARRCVGLCIETRPDVCGEAEIARMVDFGATRVELGVQVLDDRIYAEVRRGHSVADVMRATAILKRAGLKVHYHMMQGLPGSTAEHDLEMARDLFEMVAYLQKLEGTVLEEWFKQGKYRPYPADVMISLMAEIKAIVPPYVRISRVLRDIPPQYIVGGLKESVRSTVKEVMAANGQVCRCIRCREYGHRLKAGWKPGEPRLMRLDYEASKGHEIFLSFEDENGTLFGLLRLRIDPVPIAALGMGSPVALVRELHVYGGELALGTREEKAAQHHGLGKALLAEAERVALKEFGTSKIAILSGVGARQYYADLGYQFEFGYMTRDLLAKPAVTPGS